MNVADPRIMENTVRSNTTKQYWIESEKYDLDGNVERVEFYDRWANNYDAVVSELSYNSILQYCADLLRKTLLLNNITNINIENLKVLDIGCGTGLSGVALKTSGFNLIYGVDPSDGMLKAAESKGVYQCLTRGCITDTEVLATVDNSYDALFCTGCISVTHIPLSNALREFTRILKTGGIAAYTVGPSLKQSDVLQEHISYIRQNKFEIVNLEQKPYFKSEDGYEHMCDMYIIRKL